MFLAVGALTLGSCSDDLDVTNPNEQTSGTFGYTIDELEEVVIAAYHNARMEGSYARVGYTIDMCRGDEVWNSSQVWYMPFDDLNEPVTDEIGQWSYRDWYYTVTACNLILSRTTGENSEMSTDMQRIKGQALFLRGLSYYNLSGYYQNPPLITDYSTYSTMDGLYASSSSYDELLDQCEADFSEAMTLLPSRDIGGEWAGGRATCGAAAGYYARTLMVRHKYSEALTVLKAIINGDYGTYKLMENYGDNFREGTEYENNQESLFEIQYLDLANQGTDDEWTPVNVSQNATQGHAVESNIAPGDFGGWADLSASPWLYNLFKAERTTSGGLDPRLYWTICTYEPEWANFENGNVCYGTTLTGDDNDSYTDAAGTTLKTNNTNGGLVICKFSYARTGEVTTVTTGLHCGINLRLMRYSDVLLRAAECENEVNGPTQQAINWINQVRERAGLADLQLSDFATKDKLFEQIANVERPKEFGCEFGRGFDLIRWGFFYSSDRLQQLKEHGTFRKSLTGQKNAVSYSELSSDATCKSTYDTYNPGHEFLPIYQETLNDNPNLSGNSANDNTDNSTYYFGQGWTVHPVVDLE